MKKIKHIVNIILGIIIGIAMLACSKFEWMECKEDNDRNRASANGRSKNLLLVLFYYWILWNCTWNYNYFEDDMWDGSIMYWGLDIAAEKEFICGRILRY